MRSFLELVLGNLRKLGSFSGRQGRTNFWLYAAGVYVLMQGLAFVVMAPLMFASFPELPLEGGEVPSSMRNVIWIGAGLILLHFVLLAAAAVRRLHDRGLSGLFILLPLPPYVWSLSHQQDWMEEFFRPAPEVDFSQMQPLLVSSLTFWAMLVILAVLLALPAQKGENRFGPVPEDEGDEP